MEKNNELQNYIKIKEVEEGTILLSKLDGRTYLFNRETGEITLRPYWK